MLPPTKAHLHREKRLRNTENRPLARDDAGGRRDGPLIRHEFALGGIEVEAQRCGAGLGARRAFSFADCCCPSVLDDVPCCRLARQAFAHRADAMVRAVGYKY